MKLAMMLFTGVMLFGTAKDPLAEERYKAKYGRYTPAEEARLRAEKTREVAACPREVVNRPLVAETAIDARNKAKYGTATAPVTKAEPVETVMTCGDTVEPETHTCTGDACCRHCAAKPAANAAKACGDGCCNGHTCCKHGS